MNEVFVPGSEEKKEAKPVAESEGKNERDSKVIKEAIDIILGLLIIVTIVIIVFYFICINY